VEVSPLSREATFKPLSEPLQPGVRFFHDPLPALPTAPLAIGLPTAFCGRKYGLTQFHSSNTNSLGPASPPVALRVDVSLYQKETTGHLPFWFGRTPLLSPGFDNGVYQQFTCVDRTVQPSSLSVCNERTHTDSSQNRNIHG